MTQQLIDIKDLSVSFRGFKALDKVSFSLEFDDQVVGLIGPNGAGKTTLIHSILKQQVFQGNLKLNCKIAYCPDMPDFEKEFTPIEVLRQALYLKGEAISYSKVKNILVKVGLETAALRPTRGFSRGMKQRLGIAVALIQNPDVVFLDEPTSALDPIGRREILLLIKKISKEKVIVVSSHILSDIQNIADNLLVLNEGHLLYNGSTNNFLKKYNKEATLKLKESQDLKDISVFLKTANINFRVDSDHQNIFFPKEDINFVLNIIVTRNIAIIFCGIDDNGLDRAFENVVESSLKFRKVLE